VRTEQDAIRSVQRWLAGFLVAPWDIRLTVESGVEPQRPYALLEQNGTAATNGGGPAAQDVIVAYSLNLYLPMAASRQAADDAAMALREQIWTTVKWGPDLRRPTMDRIPLYAYEPRSEVQRVRVRDATAGSFALSRGGVTWTAAIPRDTGKAGLQAALDTLQLGVMLVTARGVGVFDVAFIGALAGIKVEALHIDTSALTGPGTVDVLLEGAAAPWRGPSDYLRVDSFGQTTLRDPDDPKLVQVAVDLRCAFTRGTPLPSDHMLLQRVTATGHQG
jgi:hypothetical protein